MDGIWTWQGRFVKMGEEYWIRIGGGINGRLAWVGNYPTHWEG
jgi:hypothetical protein